MEAGTPVHTRVHMKTQPVWTLAALDGCASMPCLQHISLSLEAMVLSKHKQCALTWPRFYEAAWNTTI